MRGNRCRAGPRTAAVPARGNRARPKERHPHVHAQTHVPTAGPVPGRRRRDRDRLRDPGPPLRRRGHRRVPAAGTADHTLTFENRTDERIWIGSTVNADGSAALTGLPVLDPGRSATITVPEHQGAGHWRGKFFARTGCSGEEGSTFHCAVGDCGPYADHCSTGEQPASLAEFNFDPRDALAPWYNVSYVNAVSAAVTITPDGVPTPRTACAGPSAAPRTCCRSVPPKT
ncbi:hypothetical protein SHKM778_83510 [Streptomyces sp. KM77-8]|uniref:Uncharacterized protein n=1 Tax=Streptomyces haneummycinicus TaxID=3074435 RepID=A0AAT9HYD1_9ACTN